MASTSKNLRKELRQAGFSARAIDAVWPEWWSADAEGSLSATTELRYTLARRLGLSPRSLFDGPPDFIWHDEAKFKNLGTESERDRVILSSFGTAIGRCAINALSGVPEIPSRAAHDLRAAILESSQCVTLPDLVSLCWGVGIPVMYLTVFPLGEKRMHAMTVRSGERYAILLGRESRFAAQVAYWLAHEMGHVMLQHVSASTALLELEDPLTADNPDEEESGADSYALTLLTGEEKPRVIADQDKFSASQLAHAAVAAGRERRIDPAVLALCLGHSSGQWEQVFGALKIIDPGEIDVRKSINSVAKAELDLSGVASANRDYLLTILGSEIER